MVVTKQTTSTEHLTKVLHREIHLLRIYPLFFLVDGRCTTPQNRYTFANHTRLARTRRGPNMECAKLPHSGIEFSNLITDGGAWLFSLHYFTLLTRPDDTIHHTSLHNTLFNTTYASTPGLYVVGLANRTTTPNMLLYSLDFPFWEVPTLLYGTFTHSGRAFSSGCSHPPTHSLTGDIRKWTLFRGHRNFHETLHRTRIT